MMSQKVEFSLTNQDGETISSSDLAGKKYVIFFYPRAMTPGCTMESCDFRDSYSEFADAGYEVIGVSPDPPSRNRKFKEKEGLTFDLLSDEDHELAEALGAWGEKKLYGKTMGGLIRSTFVVDEQGELEKEYRNVKATGHVARVKEDLLGV
jgi:thioredoxin-dependent peroxiredoxin